MEKLTEHRLTIRVVRMTPGLIWRMFYSLLQYSPFRFCFR
jgi:hypothetical protein